jgi:hypothetical protein
MSIIIHEQDLGQDNVDWIRRITRPGQKDAHDVSGEARDSHGQWTAGGGDDAATLAMLDASLEEQSGKRLEAAALHDYQGGASDQINELLRSGHTTPNLVESIAEIDSLMRPLSEARTLYRAIGSDGLDSLIPERFDSETLVPVPEFDDHAALAASVGTIVRDDGFMSTTSSKSVAGGKVGSDGYVVEINAPKGTMAIDINARDIGDPDFNFESEILIEHGTKMRIDGVSAQRVGGFGRSAFRGNDGKVYVIHMSVVK